MSKRIKVGKLYIGGGESIPVQSMLCVPASDVEGNVQQAVALESAGCDIIRVAVPKPEDARLVSELKKAVTGPIVADIHFDYKAAIAAVEAGADKIRINPGNIGSEDRVRAVVDACKNARIPIRVGVNSGSLQKDLLDKYGSATAEALCESALVYIKQLESMSFFDTVVSIKASDVRTMVDSCRMFSRACDYPLHLGVTEAGTYSRGLIKSSAGIGALLLDGIGDTIRVSLTADPVTEVEAGIELLRALGLRSNGVELISCPTCGRTQINLFEIAERVEKAVKGIDKPLKVAVMGCVVNGPGEASAADIGIAGGDGCAVLFKKGKVVEKIDGDIAERLIDEIKKM